MGDDTDFGEVEVCEELDDGGNCFGDDGCCGEGGGEGSGKTFSGAVDGYETDVVGVGEVVG